MVDRVISRLTALGWVVAAVAAIDAGRHARNEQRSRMLFLGGLCGVSALDDSLLLHEEVLPSLGLPETPFLALYAVAGLGLAVMWARSPRWTLVEVTFVVGVVDVGRVRASRPRCQSGSAGGRREADRCGRLVLLRRVGTRGPKTP